MRATPRAPSAEVLEAWVWLLRHLRSPYEGLGQEHLYGWEDERDRHLAALRGVLGLEGLKKSSGEKRPVKLSS